ncbi:MAG: glycosylase [Isosphaeraceae bacterium]
MNPRRWIGMALLLLPMSLAAGQAVEPFPNDLVRWAPATPTPVFTGAGGDAWDRKIRERGWILVEDGAYHLWYTGYNDDLSPNRFLGHATSADGEHWVRDPANPLVKDSWIEDMCIVKHGGRYWMFAEGKNDVAHLLTSADGRKWAEQGPLDIRKKDGTPISEGPRGTPTAWVEGSTWYLLYERGDQAIWLARSDDARRWTHVQDEPVLACGPATYDRAAVAVNQVFRRGEYLYILYHANSERPWKEWTTCIARSRDKIHWEKFPGNPILANNCSSGILVEGPCGARLYTMHPEVRVFRND